MKEEQCKSSRRVREVRALSGVTRVERWREHALVLHDGTYGHRRARLERFGGRVGVQRRACVALARGATWTRSEDAEFPVSYEGPKQWDFM
jgi:hypothetical protein